jgi:hypothetical protein
MQSGGSASSSNNNSSITTIINNKGSICWDGPPAHFMLPTHAINCRHSRSIERCPRACKGKLSFNCLSVCVSHSNLSSFDVF